MNVFALLPAAGKSVRMGRPKLALALGERTVLEHVVRAVRAAGVAEILVVLGPQVASLRDKAEAGGARVLVLENETADMRATLEIGLTDIETRWNPSPSDAFLLLPADHPTLDPDIIRSLTARYSASPENVIVIPVHHGTRGHPVLIAWRHVAATRALPPNVGLNTFIRSHPEFVMELDWPSDEILRDLDTPEEYERLQRLFS